MAVRTSFTSGEVLTAADLTDTLAQKANISTNAAWTAYTPTWSNITLGNGTVSGAFVEIGKLVVFRCQITFGSTTVMSSSPGFSLPTGAASSNPAGRAVMLRSGVTFYHAFMTGTTLLAPGTNGVAVSITSTVPWTWQTSDQINVQGTYQRD